MCLRVLLVYEHFTVLSLLAFFMISVMVYVGGIYR